MPSVGILMGANGYRHYRVGVIKNYLPVMGVGDHGAGQEGRFARMEATVLHDAHVEAMFHSTYGVSESDLKRLSRRELENTGGPHRRGTML